MPTNDQPTARARLEGSTTVNRRRFLSMAGTAAVGLTAATGTASAKVPKYYHNLDFDISCASNDTDNEVLTIKWSWDEEFYKYPGAEDPVDIAGFWWDDRKWNLVTANYYTSVSVEFNKAHSKDNYRGMTFKFYDKSAKHHGNSDETYYAKIEISPRDGWTENERNVYCDYYHTWNDTYIDALGVSTDGIYVDLGNDDKKWHKA